MTDAGFLLPPNGGPVAGEWDQRSDVLRLEVEVGGMDVSEAARLRQLEDENRRLKQLAADGSVLICFLGLTLVLIFIFVGLLQHGETSRFNIQNAKEPRLSSGSGIVRIPDDAYSLHGVYVRPSLLGGHRENGHFAVKPRRVPHICPVLADVG